MISRGLRAALVKDFQLLARDRVGLIFLTVAPIIVTTVAGLSLASLYGADPRGTSAYVFPVADEDRGDIGRALARALASESSLVVEFVADADAARTEVAAQNAGAALVIPAGTTDALVGGRSPTLALYTDPVKYLEVAHLRAVVQELRHRLARAAHARTRARLEKTRRHAERARRQFVRALDRLEAAVSDLRAESERVRSRAHADIARQVRAGIAHAAEARASEVQARLARELASLRLFLADLSERQRAFTDWLDVARARAGAFADRLPPPPDPPMVPPALRALAEADPDALAARLLGDGGTEGADPIPIPSLPALPSLPSLDLPPLPALPTVTLPGTIGITEVSVTGAPRRLNTFDQNVPGFSVTFLLLGMLLGVSLALLDERDWGTFDRVRATPTPLTTIIVAKLCARFVVGVAQMIVLLTIGRLLFGISLGPQPWALLLPTAGIVFAGTAFGLVVAGLAPSREAVLPIGSIVIVTMASVGGCWWPIDLEPPWMREVARAFPTTWAMAAFNDLMIRRQPAAAVLRSTAVLLCFGTAYAALGVALLHRGRTVAS